MRESTSSTAWTGSDPVRVDAHEHGLKVAPPKSNGGERAMSLADYPDVGRVEEVAAVLRCSKWCVYDLINSGALKSIRLGRAIRVTRHGLKEFLSV